METKTYVKMCDCPEIQKAQSFLGEEGNFFYDSQKGKYYGFPTASSIWLPRQSDIQKLLKEEPFVLAKTFNDEMENYITGDPSWWTMEGLWLAYYMWKKHGKTWGGEEWVTEEPFE